MVDLIQEAARLQSILDAQHWHYCFIGGIAVQHWGEPRLTRDLDLALLTGFGGEAQFIDTLLAHYEGRLPDAREFALARRILLLRTQSGIGIDISLAALPFEQDAMRRAVRAEYAPGVRLRICSPEDLIVMKMLAGRETDLRDVRSILVRRVAGELDWGRVEAQLAELAEVSNDAHLLARFRQIRASVPPH